MKPIIRLSRTDQPVTALPADSAAVELERPFLFLWLAIAVLSLVLAVIWRAAGSAPEVPEVLDGAGLLLWLAAPWLAAAWDRLMRRQLRHVLARRERWSWRLANMGYLLLSSLLLSLAPLALLLVYNLEGAVAQFYLLDPYNLGLPAGLWLILSLISVGPGLVIASTLLLHWLHWLLGWRWGLAIWIMLTAVANAPLVLGAGPLVILKYNQLPLPLTIGQFATWAATQVAETQAETRQLNELFGSIVKVPLMVLLAALVLGILFQGPVRRLATRLDVVWCAATSATAIVAARSAWQTWLWAGNPARQSTEEFTVLLGTGIICVWAVWLLAVLLDIDQERPSYGRLLGWSLFSVAAWVCLTLPQRITGQGPREQLLIAGAIALLVLIAGTALIYRFSRLAADRQRLAVRAGTLVLMVILVMPWPLAGTHIPPALLGYRLLCVAASSPGNPMHVYLACAVLIALSLAFWPFERRKNRHSSRALTASGGSD